MEVLGVSRGDDLVKLLMRHKVGLAHSVYADPTVLLDAKRDAIDRFCKWHDTQAGTITEPSTLARIA